MCHLTGYIGDGNCIPLLLKSLEIQEPIIGAQATGLAAMSLGKIVMEKEIGPVKNFKDKIAFIDESSIGIGHTRFALKNVTTAETNTKEKAHPFWNSDNTFVTMHNGTISNYQIFVNDLEKKGYVFRSKSVYKNTAGEEITDYNDSEIFGYLLEEELKQDLPVKTAIKNACRDIRGHFAFVVMHPEQLDKLYLANWMQPMFLAISDTAVFFSSFKIGLEPLKDKVFRKFEPPKNSLITLSKGRITIETLVPERSLPQYSPHPEKFKKIVLEALNNNANDVPAILVYISENSRKIGLLKDQFEKLSTINGYTFTPAIYTQLEILEKENLVKRKKEFVWEGGISKTPRYRFYLKK